MVAIAGKYAFVSQDKFDDYLKAVGVGMMKRTVVASTKPDIVITATGNKYKIETITSVKTIVTEFTLDTPYETDPGTGTVGKYITSLDGNTLVTKDASSGNVVAKREFSDAGFTMTMFGGSVTATRVFKRN